MRKGILYISIAIAIVAMVPALMRECSAIESFNITIDASGVSTQVKVDSNAYLPAGTSSSCLLTVGIHTLYTKQIGLIATFEVTANGDVQYNSIYEGFMLQGNGTSVLRVIGHPITIDSSDIDVMVLVGNQFWADGYLGWMSARSSTTVNLVASTTCTYRLFSGLGREFAYFYVLPTGIVSYDPVYEGGIITGNGTSTIKITGHDITLDASDVDLYVTIGSPFYTWSFLGWTPGRQSKTYSLIANPLLDYNLHSSQGREFASFALKPEGYITYSLTYEGCIITGNGTSTIKITGHNVTIDASDVDVYVTVGPPFYPQTFIGWTAGRQSRTYSLIANTVYDYNLHTAHGYTFAYFAVKPEGYITYSSDYEGGIITGNGTSTIKITGHNVTVDASGVDVRITIGSPFFEESNLGYVPLRQNRTYSLVANGQYDYVLFSSIGYGFARFAVKPNGTIQYAEALEGGVVTGCGTTTIKPTGHPIMIDASEVDQKIGLSYWGNTGTFLGWTEARSTRTFFLVANTLNPYWVETCSGRNFAGFKVNPSGNAVYDASYENAVTGNNTSTIRPRGYLVVIDNSNVTYKVGFGYPGNPNDFLGWIEPGQVKSYYLAVNGPNKYPLYMDYTRVGEFVLFKNNTCSPVVVSTAYGTVRLFTDQDTTVPIIEWNYTGSFTDADPGCLIVNASDASGLLVDPSGTYAISSTPGTYSFTFTATDADDHFPGDTLSMTISVNITIVDDDTEAPVISWYYTGNYTDGNPGYIVVNACDALGLLSNPSGIYPVNATPGIHCFSFTAVDADNDYPGDSLTTTISFNITIVDDDTDVPVIFGYYTGDYTDGNPGYIVVMANDSSGLSVDPSGVYPVSNEIGVLQVFTFIAVDADNDRPGDFLEAIVSFNITIIDDDTEQPVIDSVTYPCVVFNNQSNFLIAVNASDNSGIDIVMISMLGTDFCASLADGIWYASIPTPVVGNYWFTVIIIDADNDTPDDSLLAAANFTFDVQESSVVEPLEVMIDVLGYTLDYSHGISVTFQVTANQVVDETYTVLIQIEATTFTTLGTHTVKIMTFGVFTILASVVGPAGSSANASAQFVIDIALVKDIVLDEIAVIETMIENAPSEYWRNQNNLQTMINKMDELIAFVSNCQFQEAYNKLLNDIKPKLTGVTDNENNVVFGNGVFKNAWILDGTLRLEFEIHVDAVLWALNLLATGV